MEASEGETKVGRMVWGMEEEQESKERYAEESKTETTKPENLTLNRTADVSRDANKRGP